ncbi:MAG: molybdopterin adenylyltransferase [Candidatus Omnitrophota bacterium]
MKIGILTISDRASRKEYEDLSGKAVSDLLNTYLISPWTPISKIIPDEQKIIEEALKHLSDQEKCCLVITTGGTGPSARDVTPEATNAVCDKMLPGFGEQMRNASLAQVPTAILSRQTAGIRQKTLIVNLPGRPQAIEICLKAIFPAIPDCLNQIGAPLLKCNSKIIKVLRHE